MIHNFLMKISILSIKKQIHKFNSSNYIADWLWAKVYFSTKAHDENLETNRIICTTNFVVALQCILDNAHKIFFVKTDSFLNWREFFASKWLTNEFLFFLSICSSINYLVRSIINRLEFIFKWFFNY